MNLGNIILQAGGNKEKANQVWVAHTYNPSWLGSWDQEDQGSRTDQANNSQDPISEITRETGGMAQAAECLLCKHEPEFKSQ
jgi:hypothetical protein